MKIVAIAIVVLLIIGVGLAVALHKSNNGNGSNGGSASSHQSAESAQLAALAKKGSSLTAGDLSSFNQADLFYAVFRNAAEQPVVTTTRSFYQTQNLNDQPPAGKVSLRQTGFDYRSKQLSYADSVVYSGTGDEEFNRCSNGKEYSYQTLFAENGWQAQTGAAANDDCSKTNNYNINDGLNAGGLTSAQAQKFVDALRGYNGLITVNKMSVTTFQGKPYLRFDVTVNKLANGSVSGGVMFFNKAFDATGVDSTALPYVTSASAVSGAKLAYFVDPSTQLPAYSQMAYTPTTPTGPWDNDQMLYSFAGTLPTYTLDTNNVQPLSMPWPIATLVQ